MPRVTMAACSVLLTLSLAGCGDLLKQTAPSRVNADGLAIPANAKLLVDGARAAFGCALQAYVTGAGLMTDEMEDTQLAAAAWDYDRRAWTTVVGVAYAESPCDVGQIFGVYRPMQVARYQSDYALETVKGYFQILFRKLFGGGQADILLEENVDILDAGIEIIARPPGKEPRNISLLSGGQ